MLRTTWPRVMPASCGDLSSAASSGPALWQRTAENRPPGTPPVLSWGDPGGSGTITRHVAGRPEEVHRQALKARKSLSFLPCRLASSGSPGAEGAGQRRRGGFREHGSRLSYTVLLFTSSLSCHPSLSCRPCVLVCHRALSHLYTPALPPHAWPSRRSGPKGPGVALEQPSVPV